MRKRKKEEKMNEIQRLNNQIDFNNLIYYFQSTSALKYLIRFKGSLISCNNIKNGYINIKK